MRLLEADFDVVHRASIKHEAPDSLLRLKTDGTDKSNFDEELSVLVVYEPEEQHEVKTEYIGEDQAGKEQSNNHMDSNGE